MAIIPKAISDTTDELSIKSRWGITANEYTIGGKRVDLQDLMVAVSKRRAVAVEGEVAPQATRIRERNDKLDRLGQALADLTGFQAGFTKDETGEDDGHGWFKLSTANELKALGFYWSVAASLDNDRKKRPDFYCLTGNQTQFSAKKKIVEQMVQSVKSKIDALNNEAQLDMSRLQQLVDRRDESYSTATNLMTAISDTRANLIRAL